jgi:hypothetical protein
MRTAIVLLFAMILVPGPARSAPTMFPLPPGAERPGHVVLHPSIAEQDFFWMKVPYPSTPALDHYDRVFSKWHQCSSPDPGWVSYGDLADGANRFLHNFVRYWISPQNDMAVTVLLRYESQGIAYRERPDNDEQFVAVIRHRVANAAAFLADLKVTCPPAPNRRVNRTAQQLRCWVPSALRASAAGQRER